MVALCSRLACVRRAIGEGVAHHGSFRLNDSRIPVTPPLGALDRHAAATGAVGMTHNILIASEAISVGKGVKKISLTLSRTN